LMEDEPELMTSTLEACWSDGVDVLIVRIPPVS
jgi:hypothetical protein